MLVENTIQVMSETVLTWTKVKKIPCIGYLNISTIQIAIANEKIIIIKKKGSLSLGLFCLKPRLQS